jgi:hypothetical protein
MLQPFSLRLWGLRAFALNSFSIFVSYTPSTHNPSRPAQKKRTDRKKDPFFLSFGRKTGVEGLPKNTFFYIFSRISCFLRSQAVVFQNFPQNSNFTKKSCLKTYRRFFVFAGCANIIL